MNSVLLVGCENFIADVQSQVRGLDSLTVVTAMSMGNAMARLETLTPDVVMIQASVLADFAVLKAFGQTQMAYVVVVDTEVADGQALTPEAASFFADDTDPVGVEAGEPLPYEQLIEQTAAALEAGADAYIQLPVSQGVESNRGLVSLDMRSRGRYGSGRDSSRQPASSMPEKSAPSAAPLRFTRNQCRLIQAHIQLGLSQAQRYRDLSRINDWLSAVAMMDALTQLNNRRAFDLELPNLVQLARTKQTPLSLMMLDIDHFKSVNDRFGHLVGDEVLKQLAQRLLTNMRFYDTPFRYGGEEFVVTLMNTDLDEALVIANRICELIAQKPFEMKPPINGIKPLEITLSVGMTALRADDDSDGRSFLDRADQNLLAAKGAGRNQVVAS